MKSLKRFTYLVGTVSLGYFSYDVGYRYYYHKINTSEINFKAQYGSGSYAIVTGGSKGLGKEYAIELANRGHNLVLIARDQTTLNQAQEELKQKFPGADVKAIPFDLSSNNPAAYEQLLQKVQGLDVSILVNNVGMFNEGLLHQQDPKVIDNLIKTNTLPLTYLTSLLIPTMIKRNNRSLIINVGSEAGEFNHKEFAVYCATKAYLNHFTRSLQLFYKGSNLDIALFLPGPTDTPLLAALAPEFKETLYGKTFCANAANSAKESLRKVGYQPVIFGDTKHEFYHIIYKYFRPISDYVFSG